MRALYYVLLLVTPLLMTNQTSEMFELPKILFIYTIVSTISILWLWGAAVGKIHLSVRREHFVVGVFVLAQMLATVFSVDLHTSIFGYYGRFNGGLLSTIMYALLYFIATQIFDYNSFRKLLIFSVVSSIFVLMWGIPGRLLGVDLSCVLFRGDFSTSCWTNEFRPQERMFSTIGQPNWLGVYLMAHVFIGIYLLLNQIRTHRYRQSTTSLRANSIVSFRACREMCRGCSYIYVIYIALMAFGVFLTGSRSSEVGLVVGAIVGGLMLIHHQGKHTLSRISLGLVITGGILIGAWYGYKLWSSRTDEITHSGTIRLIVWEGALKLAARYPFLGTGPETFAYTYFLTRPEAHNFTTERDFIYNKVHNEFLHFLANSGVLGFATYAYLIYSFLRSLKHRQGGYVLISGIVGISVANFFGFSTTTSQLLLFILPAFGLLHESGQSSVVPPSRESQGDPFGTTEGQSSRQYPSNLLKAHRGSYLGVIPTPHLRAEGSLFIKIVCTTIALLLWAGTTKYFIDYYRADLAYAQALQDQSAGDSVQSVESFTKALGLRFEHIYADKFALVSAQTAYVLAQVNDKATYAEQVSGFIRIAERMQNVAIRSSPANPMYWKDRVRMYKVLVEVVPTTDKPRIQMQISNAISTTARLSPTDLEVREWRSLNSAK